MHGRLLKRRVQRRTVILFSSPWSIFDAIGINLFLTTSSAVGEHTCHFCRELESLKEHYCSLSAIKYFFEHSMFSLFVVHRSIYAGQCPQWVMFGSHCMYWPVMPIDMDGHACGNASRHEGILRFR